MPWKGYPYQQTWSTQDWTWEKQPRKRDKGKAKTEEGTVIYDYEGKRIDVQGASSRASSAWSGPGQAEAALKEENKKLKQAFRDLAARVNPRDGLISDDVKDIIEIDPREDLKERQRLLNEERKQLNKATKLKDTLQEKESKYSQWKADMEAGLKIAEKKHSHQVAELQEAVKSAEKGEEALQVDSDSEVDGNPAKMEIKILKDQLQHFMTYAASMEQRQQQMQEQMMMVLTAIQPQNGPIGLGRMSPQQPVRVKREHEEGSGEDWKDRRRSRSRPRRDEKEVVLPVDGIEVLDMQTVKENIESLPEPCQLKILDILKADPGAFCTLEQLQSLIDVQMKEFQASLKPQMGSSAALMPFGKVGTPKARRTATPYVSPNSTLKAAGKTAASPLGAMN